jgi:hypothetical protein
MREIDGKNGGKLKIPEKGETNNLNGRPPKAVSAFNKEMRALGYEPVGRAQVKEVYEILLALTREGVIKIANDGQQPIILQIAARRLLEKQYEALELMLDRAHGKAKSEIGVTDQQGNDVTFVTIGVTSGLASDLVEAGKKGKK